ncbi:sulfatase-like hydrolase/transferase [Hoeflea sp. G2-23]|uniref:Sulfatase-like hydrolase/transferase n=1 Tax=Hoeflea algicola TaxID=2983763 RepID=A0ABT3Z9A1_9HYPH|nr:sulfatase-like hydrolase/transferase [Hoeflea algicola]MCY0148365.1 sulfatase-like hydrolase/transferase [Hoeflea algicola]
MKLIAITKRLILNPVAAVAALVICTAFLYLLERAINHMPFVILSVLGMATVIFLLSRKAYFSIYTALTLTTLISVASVLKYRTKGFDLHAYDVIFTGTDPKAFAFLLDEFTIYIVPFAGLMLCAVLALALVFIWDRKSRITAPWRAGLMAATFALIPVSYPLKADEPRYFHYLGGFNASAFFVSFLDIKDAALGRGIGEKFAKMPAAEPFAAPEACGATGPKPDLFVVLSESQSDLSRLNEFGIDQHFSKQFKSADGNSHGLRVETFGGGTWISNFSFLTGLSSLDFGWQAPYLTTAMEGRINYSLATELKRCGYRTAVLMPMKFTFVNEGPFLKSIGVDEVLDFDRIGASEYAHHDRFYYEAARAFIEEHRKTDGRPLFLQVQTMFAHSPYSAQLAASSPADDIETGNAELDEYIRRVDQAQQDFRWFLGQTEADSKRHPSIVLEFGDHQSFATRDVITQQFPDFAIDNLTSSAYQSFFTVHGYGVDVDMRPFQFANLDIGYLGVSLLEAAGLEESPMYANLGALRDRCEGRLFYCPDRTAVDQHLNRRIASGYLVVE